MTEEQKQSYKNYIRGKIPNDSNLDIFVSPNLPATKLGKILMKETRIGQPGDVVALHVDPGFFSSNYVIFTADACYHPGGNFLYEDLKSAGSEGDTILVVANRLGQLVDHRIKVKNGAAASLIANVLEDLMHFDPDKTGTEETKAGPDYAQFEGMAIDWLKLRDEVMRTIDLLFEKFQDGKLSLIEWEEKKADLLSRL